MTHRLITARPAIAVAVIIGLFGFVAVAAAQSNPVKLVKGTITNARSGKPVDGGRLNVYKGTATETFAFSKINPRTGAYQLILAPSTEYRFEVVSPRFYTTSFAMRSSDGSGYEESVRDFQVEPIPMGTSLFAGHPFDPGSAKLNTTSQLQGVIDQMKRQSAIVVTIGVIPDMPPVAKKPAPKKPKKGTTAIPAQPATNVPVADPAKQLADDRVAALRNWFKSQGISTARLQWDVRPAVVTPKGRTTENVSIKITGVLAESESDD